MNRVLQQKLLKECPKKQSGERAALAEIVEKRIKRQAVLTHSTGELGNGVLEEFAEVGNLGVWQ